MRSRSYAMRAMNLRIVGAWRDGIAGNASGGYGGTALATFALTQNLSPADVLSALLSEQQTIL